MMQLRDLREVAFDETLEVDVCIVGTGPAGLTIAHELSAPHVRVVLLESGGRERDAWHDDLNEVENVGVPRQPDQWLVRNRLLGGTSATWNGKLATFDDIDFAHRPWVPGSRWPFGRETLRPYLVRSMTYLGTCLADNTRPQIRSAAATRWPNLDPALFEPYAWSYSCDPGEPTGPVRFGSRAQRTEMPGVTCYLNATVTHLDTDAAARHVARVEVSTPDRQRLYVRARHVVLAAGAIENARLLLASNRLVPGGLGNANDRVGRYLMDHPRNTVGTFRRADRYAAQRLFNPLVAPVPMPTTLFPGVALSRAAQEREELLNAALFVHYGDIGPDDPFRALQALARFEQPRTNLGRVVAGRDALPAGVAAVLARRPPPLRDRPVFLQCMVEQPPDPDSRITLSSKTDALGVPRAMVDWRLGDQERRTVEYAVIRFSAEAARLGLPVPELAAMFTDPQVPFFMYDVSHVAGTTRMSVLPRDGVVDVNCTVHGIDNLHIAGSSVFPTSGHANPTQMIVALAVRLADHLKDALGG